MIPAHYLETWKDYHFWKTYEQTEQDLVIEHIKTLTVRKLWNVLSNILLFR